MQQMTRMFTFRRYHIYGTFRSSHYSAIVGALAAIQEKWSIRMRSHRREGLGINFFIIIFDRDRTSQFFQV